MTLQEILFIIAIVFFVLAGILILLAMAVFFVRNIPDVRADLSGKKRAEAVAKIAAQRPGRDRRKGVARVEPTSGHLGESGRLDNQLNQVPHVNSVVTDAPAQPQQTFQPQAAAPVQQGAAPVSDDSSTTILPDDAQSTTILQDDSAATTVLESPAVVDRPAAETPVLDQAQAGAVAASFDVVRKIVLRESEEVINPG